MKISFFYLLIKPKESLKDCFRIKNRNWPRRFAGHGQGEERIFLNRFKDQYFRGVSGYLSVNMTQIYSFLVLGGLLDTGFRPSVVDD